MKPNSILKKLPIIVLIVLGCGRFVTWVDISLEAQDDSVAELFSTVEAIAEKYDLHKNESESIPGKKVGFYGKPYHYYTFEVKDSTEKAIVVKFTHRAMVSFPIYAGCEPENEFLKAVEDSIHSDIIEIEYYIIK